jgi:hypothetical protein
MYGKRSNPLKMAKVTLTISVDMSWLADDVVSDKNTLLGHVDNLWFGLYRDDLQDESAPVEILTVVDPSGEVIYDDSQA